MEKLEAAANMFHGRNDMHKIECVTPVRSVGYATYQRDTQDSGINYSSILQALANRQISKVQSNTMGAFGIRAAALLVYASLGSATLWEVQNYCHESIWLTFANVTETRPSEVLPSGEAYVSNLEGENKSLGVTWNESDYWTADGKKLILGASISNNLLYWTISSVNGDPFAGDGFKVTSNGNVCGNATTVDGQYHVCDDSDDNVTLTLAICSDNA